MTQRPADPVGVAVAPDRLEEGREDLAVLPQVPLGDRDLADRAGLDVEELDVPLEAGLGLAAVEDLDDVRLVAVVPQQVEPALEAAWDRTGR